MLRRFNKKFAGFVKSWSDFQSPVARRWR